MESHPLTAQAAQTNLEDRRASAHTTVDLSMRGAAAIAGLGLLFMAIVAGIIFAALENLTVTGNAAETAGNIAEHELRFRFIAFGFMFVAILDVIVAWALYVLLAPVNRSIALVSAWLRVVYAAIFAAASGNLFAALRPLTDSDSFNGFGVEQLNAQVMMSVNAFNDEWDAALAIFGLHLLVLGYLVYKSGYIPRALGILVMIASIGYLVDSVAGFLWTGYDVNLALFTFIGEVLLLIWLLWKAARPGTVFPRPANGD